ncbi:long-chain-fatty-acid--CoA ligase ACSBG2-like [Paramacrobiotus metropolitanus]|uniref:long-chain-fatty-acid--CoA ligase ACSBG2-like n=1 Tax=Paramacrobiotus metropolitanus TaxID=2943436 RepID=UPI0024456403|nr:long-chain-fatty-acid--CoA ligase ACSBG2-like [Paramacrobiotus metropolitanus]
MFTHRFLRGTPICRILHNAPVQTYRLRVLSLRAYHGKDFVRCLSTSCHRYNDAECSAFGTCVPAKVLYTHEPHVPVKLRLSSGSAADAEPALIVPEWFAKKAEEHASSPALTMYRGGTTTTWTYAEYIQDVRTAAKGFIKLGLKPFYSVATLGFNAPEWVISDLGAIFAGGLSVGVYTTNTPEACRFVLKAARANIVVVEDDMQLQKILKYRSELPDIKAIIQYTGEPDRRVRDIYSWEEFMALGETVSDAILDSRQAAMAPNTCATVIFTSGTTGVPKGAMLSHDNLIWTANSAIRDAKITGKQTFVSYLPLSHVAAYLADVFLPIVTGGHVHFAQPNALKDKNSLVNTLRTAKPTAMVGVPRVWEKMEEQIRAAMTNRAVLNVLFERAQKVGMQAFHNRQIGKAPPLEWLWTSWIYKIVRNRLGLDRCTHTCSGAAPLMPETQEFFLSMDIPIYDIYGLSETSAPHSLNLPGEFKLGSAGKTLTGAKTKIKEPNNDGVGEICMYGRHIFMGYLGMEKRTKYAFDEQGYFKTGDMGMLDEDGYLFVTGRIKEVIVTAGGEKVSPIPVEDRIKEHLPIVSHAMLIGDKRRFIAVLLTLKSEMDLKKGQPLSMLTDTTRAWIKAKSGATITTVEEARKSEPLREAISTALEAVNEKAVSRAQRINQFAILPVDFSIPGGELGPTLKVRRSVIAKKYESLIDDIYEQSNISEKDES